MILLAIAALLVSGCGGGGGGGATAPSIVAIDAPAAGATVAGNVPVTATLNTLTGVTKVNFKVNGVIFDTAAPAATVSGRLDTLSVGLGNADQTITVETVGVASSASRTITVNNGRSLYVQDVSGSAGSNVVVRVRLNDVTTVGGYHVVLNYDAAALQLDAASVAAGAAVPGTALFVKDTSVAGVIDATVTGNEQFTNASGGEVMVATFTIIAPSAIGTKNDITMPTAIAKDTANAPIGGVVGVAGRVVTE